MGGKHHSGRYTLGVDFDGVLHSYTSGHQGPRRIPDPIVPGAIHFLLESLREFDVAVYSTRARYWGGRAAMKRWLRSQAILYFDAFTRSHSWSHDKTTLEYAWLEDSGLETHEPWGRILVTAAARLVAALQWPVHKPACVVLLDDRAMCFDGTWPSMQMIHSFRPWNRKE